MFVDVKVDSAIKIDVFDPISSFCKDEILNRLGFFFLETISI